MSDQKLTITLRTNVTPTSPPSNLPQSDSRTFVQYFENGHGEQLVFVFKKGDAFGTLWHSDCDWASFKITDQAIEELANPWGAKCIDLGLDGDEYLWLRACWGAAEFWRKYHVGEETPNESRD